MHLRLLVLCLFVAAGSLFSVRAEAPAAPQTYAVLVGGMGGQEGYGKWYADWLGRFQTYLTGTVHVPADHVAVLSDKAATTEAIGAALTKFGQQAKPQDQLIVFLVGHGEVHGSTPTIILPGPDLTATQLAAWLKAFPAQNQVILNFTASSGDFLKALSAPGRINLTATSATEQEEPVFPEFFLRGLESKRADADKNGTITLLEAFNWAAQQTAWWIARWSQVVKDAGAAPNPDEPTVWKASGKETIEIFEKLYSSMPNRKLDPGSDRNAADQPAELRPPDGQVTPEWANRRVVDEHALLEDSGQGIGVTVITDKGIELIQGQKPGDPGNLASRTSLGHSAPATP